MSIEQAEHLTKPQSQPSHAPKAAPVIIVNPEGHDVVAIHAATTPCSNGPGKADAAASAASAAGASGSRAPSNTHPATRAEKPRILLVDDEPHVVAALALRLERDFDVTTATSPFDALALVRERSFHAIVSDLRMPNMNGVTLLEAVKKISPSTARLLLTGQGDVESAAAAINNASVHVFLMKPCVATRVGDSIRKAMASNNGIDSETLAELGRKAALGGFAGSIGHEMANLVAALSGSLASVRESLATGAQLSDEDMSILDLVNMRLQGHVNQLKDLSKPKPLAITDVDVAGLVVQTVGIMQRVGMLRTARVRTELPTLTAIAKIDRASVEGVLMNLFKNAAEAIDTRIANQMSEGRLPDEGRIDVVVRVDESRVWVEVHDNGCGIASDRLPRLFEPFRSTKGQRGNGLGLGIVRTTLERQRGAITVTSTLDVGTRFVIELPRSVDA